MTSLLKSRFAQAALVTSILIAPAAVAAQAAPAHAAAAPRTPATAAPQTSVATETDPDARQTRSKLEDVLRRYPPEFAYVLKLDPSLMSNAPYMASYPVLQEFLSHHPDVVRNPAFYFSEYTVRDRNDDGDRYTPERQAMDMWRSAIGDFLFLTGFLAVVVAIFWIIKSIIDHRRWSRLSKVQSEVHNKLIDRLASNDEMMAYIQSPAGAGFLKAGPGQLDANAARSMHAPYGRILWSAQAGVVLLALGLGLRWVNVNAPVQAADMLHFFGMIGQSLGLGFLVSAGMSFVLSRRMGLISEATMEREPTKHS